jgi:glucose-1-phosphate adenylyltransferase
MLLAGGQGSRLRLLTKNLAKPAVPFAGQYRIIDFSLSNCVNSGIEVVGVLTQYKPQFLNAYVGTGSSWDLTGQQGGVTVLPPYVGEKGGQWYKGTAHAVYQNLGYIENHDPAVVLILSGDHIYKMDYARMLDYHQKKGAQVTIAVIEVPWAEAGRFGIINKNQRGQIMEFREKPENPSSNLASMGVYVFNTDILKYYLIKDAQEPDSENDFGKNVIPRMLKERVRLYAYPFTGYWKDVGTIDSYWQASMDLLDDPHKLDIFDSHWGIYSQGNVRPPHYVAGSAVISQSLVAEGGMLCGQVQHSIIFPGVYLGTESLVKDSVIMTDVRIEKNTVIERAIIGENTQIGSGSLIGGNQGEGIIVVEDNQKLPPNSRIGVLLRMLRQDKPLGEMAGARRQ